MIKAIFFSTFFFFLSSREAYAYIDPGTGAYLIQAFFAILAAVFFYFRHPIQLIKALLNFFKRKK